MALVDTDNTPKPGKGFNSVNDIVRALRGAHADELSATNLYSKIVDALRYMNGYDDVIAKIEEIKNDELNHQGVLMQLVAQLSANELENILKGFNGEESHEEEKTQPDADLSKSDAYMSVKDVFDQLPQEFKENEVVQVTPEQVKDIPMGLFDAK